MKIFGLSLKSLMIPLIIFAISLIFTYSYIDFSSSASVGTGHVFWAKSIALDRTFNVNNYWGNAGVDILHLGDDYYPVYAPLTAIIMAGPYLVLQFLYYLYTNFVGPINGDLSIILESLTFSLPASLALLGILILLAKFMKDFPKIVLVGLGLGTIAFTYSVSFFNHIIAAFFVFLAYYLVTRMDNKYRYFFSGIFVGLAFLAEFPTAFFSIAILVGEIVRLVEGKVKFNRFVLNLSIFAIPVAIAIALILVFNTYVYGGPFNFGEFLFRDSMIANEQQPFGFYQNPLYGLYGEYFSPMKGMFVYSPFLIFALFGIKAFFRENRYAASIALAYLVVISLVYSMWSDCFGATVYGNRYEVSFLPFFALFLAYFVKSHGGRPFIKWVLGILIAISIILTLGNTWLGIAQGRMSQCEEYLNTYTPYHRLYEGFVESDSIKTSPVLFKGR